MQLSPSDAQKSVLIVVQQQIRKYLIGLCRSPFFSLSHLKDIPWDMKSLVCNILSVFMALQKYFSSFFRSLRVLFKIG